MSDYTPTTEEVRLAWWMHVENPADNEGDSDLAFDCWLAEVEREAAERAWREGYYTGKRDYAGSVTGGMPISTPNPYSAAEIREGDDRGRAHAN